MVGRFESAELKRAALDHEEMPLPLLDVQQRVILDAIPMVFMVFTITTRWFSQGVNLHCGGICLMLHDIHCCFFDPCSVVSL